MKKNSIRKKLTIVIIILFLLTNYCISIGANEINGKNTRNINTINNTIIVDINGAGNYTKIQDAIDNASEEDIIRVWDGIYNENIIINKTLQVIGNSSKTTEIVGFGVNNSVVSIISNNVIFSNFNVRNGDFIGIEIVASRDVKINNNNVNNNTYGIWNLLCNSNTVESNNFINNEEEAISISLSLNIFVTKNNFINNTGEIGHAFFWNSLFNRWQENYWDDLSGEESKKITGQFDILTITIPWANYDTNPATEPYGII